MSCKIITEIQKKNASFSFYFLSKRRESGEKSWNYLTKPQSPIMFSLFNSNPCSYASWGVFLHRPTGCQWVDLRQTVHEWPLYFRTNCDNWYWKKFSLYKVSSLNNDNVWTASRLFAEWVSDKTFMWCPEKPNVFFSGFRLVWLRHQNYFVTKSGKK